MIGLPSNPVPDRAEVVADVLVTGRLNAEKMRAMAEPYPPDCGDAATSGTVAA